MTCETQLQKKTVIETEILKQKNRNSEKIEKMTAIDYSEICKRERGRADTQQETK